MGNPAAAAAFADTKPHYAALDGLRGVAALLVVCFHVFEAFATSHLDQRLNHGYLAVDLFFILSGFVTGYAYDDRWPKMTLWGFFRRRLIRLHPLVVLGAVFGAAIFYTQGCAAWDVARVPLTALLGAMALNALLIPMTPSAEIRGVGEMFPLNGPCWSLGFEYLGSALYALILRRLSTAALGVWTALAGAGLATFAIGGPLGDICVGYSLNPVDFCGGALRLLFSFSAGLLMARCGTPRRIRGAFLGGGLVVVLLLAMPRLGGAERLWLNGVYDALCVLVVFPALVFLVACDASAPTHLCAILGDLSYPLYIVHYPLIYLYYAWVKNNGLTFTQSLPGAAALLAASLLLAALALRFYDRPIRRRFQRKRTPGTT